MKIALCQINPTVGAINQNKKSILDSYDRALDLKADIIVFPELAIIGYPPQDLLLRDHFIKNAKDALDEIAQKSTIPIILGNTLIEDNKLYNCAFICEKGEIVSHYKKRLLPTYDVFDEDRYFSPGNEHCIVEVLINGKNTKLGLQICEDLWDKNYSCDLAKELKEFGAEMIINISASPYRVDRLLERCKLIQGKAKDNSIPYIYCNLVGAQDELIFDGQSLAYDQNGQLIAQGKAFEEQIIMVDFEVSTEELLHRLTGRSTCSGCGAMFHVASCPPLKRGICDSCGKELYQREDDNRETIKKRLEVYENETTPLREYYKKQGNLKIIQGSGSVEEIFAKVCLMVS